MELIHLHTNVTGVRFFRRAHDLITTKLETSNYCYYKTVDFFRRKLRHNLDSYDVVLVMMHGAEDSFLLPKPLHKRIRGKYFRAITLDDAVLMKNDCVIAIACSTAKDFGPEAVSKGALAYLGYDEMIERVFNVFTGPKLQINSNIRSFYENQVKTIYTDVVAESIANFINEFQTLEILKQSITFHFEKRINELFNLSAESIRKDYDWNVDTGLWNKEWPKLKMLQLQIINDVSPHFIIIGDKGYIPLLGVNRSTNISERALKRIDTASFIDKDYEIEFHSTIKTMRSAV